MDQLERLDAAISQHVEAIHRTAETSPAGGGPAWDGLLRHYGLAPLDATERGVIVQGMRLARRAVPAEVRMALVGLAAWASREIDRTCRCSSSRAASSVSTSRSTWRSPDRRRACATRLRSRPRRA